jgi:hypothetical protein
MLNKFVAGIPLALAISQPYAHHSGAIFDDGKSTTLTGTVKAFQWTNPHCWIQVLVPGEGGSIEWSVEMGSPSQLYRGGLRPGSLKPGDRITVVVHPMRDGSNGGLFVSAVGPDGNALGSPAASNVSAAQ